MLNKQIEHIQIPLIGKKDRIGINSIIQISAVIFNMLVVIYSMIVQEKTAYTLIIMKVNVTNYVIVIIDSLV